MIGSKVGRLLVCGCRIECGFAVQGFAGSRANESSMLAISNNDKKPAVLCHYGNPPAKQLSVWSCRYHGLVCAWHRSAAGTGPPPPATCFSSAAETVFCDKVLAACIEGVIEWAIGTEDNASCADSHVLLLYDTLEAVVFPLFYENAACWCWMMMQAIGKIGYYFNIQRMMRRYASDAYLR
jgi:hypothetical protein